MESSKRDFGYTYVYDLHSCELRQKLRMKFNKFTCKFTQFTRDKLQEMEIKQFYSLIYNQHAEDVYIYLTLFDNKKCCFLMFEDGTISLMSAFGSRDLYTDNTMIFGRMSSDVDNMPIITMIELMQLNGLNPRIHFTLLERNAFLHCINIKMQENHQLATKFNVVHWEPTDHLYLACFRDSTIILCPSISNSDGFYIYP